MLKIDICLFKFINSFPILVFIILKLIISFEKKTLVSALRSNYTLKIAYISVFGALALVVSLSKFEIPYPIAPFLKIDFSEIIDILALFLGGEYVGLLTATVHFLGLMVNTEFLIGPPLKYIAVISMFLGVLLTGKIFGSWKNWGKREMGISMLISSIVRAIVMVIINIIVILWIAPEFYDFFAYQLTLLGYSKITLMDVILYTSLVVGSYNIIQTVITMIVGQSIYFVGKEYTSLK